MRTCAACGKNIAHKRVDAQHCNARCRTAASKSKAAENLGEAGLEPGIATTLSARTVLSEDVEERTNDQGVVLRGTDVGRALADRMAALEARMDWLERMDAIPTSVVDRIDSELLPLELLIHRVDRDSASIDAMARLDGEIERIDARLNKLAGKAKSGDETVSMRALTVRLEGLEHRAQESGSIDGVAERLDGFMAAMIEVLAGHGVDVTEARGRWGVG